MEGQSMYQVSTLQALSLGYSRGVISVEELLKHGDTGLGTFENVDGEMIVLDGICYQAAADGTAVKIPDGSPFFDSFFFEGTPQFFLRFCSRSENADSVAGS